MKRRKPSYDLASIVGLPAACAVFLLAQVLEGGSVRSLWQPTAALVVFGGTLAAVLVSYPYDVVIRTGRAIRRVFATSDEPIEPLLKRIVEYSVEARRKGLIALENEVDRAPDPF